MRAPSEKAVAVPVLAAALLLPLPALGISNYYVHLSMVIAIYMILLMGLDIVVGYTGETSLAHAALFATGAYTAGVLLFKLGLGFWAALPASLAVSSLFGLLLSIPALRVRGPYLAMVTAAFGAIVQILINEMSFLTNGPMGIRLNRPHLLGILPKDREYYYLVLAILALALLAVRRIVGSSFGRAFQALRDAPIASECLGVSVWRYKVYAFAISAALAGLAGCLFAYSEQYISPNTYSIELSILFLLAITLGGTRSWLGALLGAAIVVLLPNLLADIALVRIIAALIGLGAVTVLLWRIRRDRAVSGKTMDIPVALCLAAWPASRSLASVTDFKLTIFGLMILFTVYQMPDGITGRLIRPSPPSARPFSSDDGFAARQDNDRPDADLLSVENLVRQFGGLVALAGVSLRVKVGEIHGLIGPNGSGKSTLINVLSGLYPPSSGLILFQGLRLDGLSPSAIALSGVARTFQNLQLFGEMTVFENVLVALNHDLRGGLPDVVLGTPRRRESEAKAQSRALALLDFVGLAGLAGEKARNLPYGKGRLLEIARALALRPKILLLDEPAAGLTRPEIDQLVVNLRKIRDQGIAIVLIEHHIDLVVTLCDRVTVLDFGRVIAEDEPQALCRNQKVIDAYLGVQAEPS